MLRVLVERIEPDHVVGTAAGTHGGPITVPLDELFVGARPPEVHAALIRAGDEIVRVGQLIDVEMLPDGTWSRRSLALGRSADLTPGQRVVGQVVDIAPDWMLVALEQGVPAKVHLPPLRDYLLAHDAATLHGEGRIDRCGFGIGDYLAGFLSNCLPGKTPHVDVVGHLERCAGGRIEKDRLRIEELREAAPEHAPPAYHAPQARTMAECPAGTERVLVVEDDLVWAQGDLRQWLAASGAALRVVGPDEWDRTQCIALEFDPEIVMVDLVLEENDKPSVLATRIIKALSEAGWSVIAITGQRLGDDRALLGLPPNVKGPVRKSEDFTELADAIASIADAEALPLVPPSAEKSPEARQGMRERRDGLILAVLDEFARMLSARTIAVFSYSFAEDRARLRYSSDTGLDERFTPLADDLQKSQIRDLAFDARPHAVVRYPDLTRQRSWRWLGRLMPFHEAYGIRLRLPHDTDHVWSLFAFWTDGIEASHERVREVLQSLVSLVEDCCVRVELEERETRDRSLYMKGQYVRELGHEVKRNARNMQNVVRASVEDLADGAVDLSSVLACLGDLGHRATKLHKLGESLLGREVTATEPVSLASVLARCVVPYGRPTSPYSQARNVHVPLPAVVPNDLHVMGDPALVESIVDNLLANAVDAIEKTRPLRSPTDGAYYGQVCVEAFIDETDSSWAIVRVSDTGVGIPRRIHERMWDHGFSTKADAGGTGLGTAISRFAAGLLGGSLRVEETVLYVGSALCLRLPVAAHASSDTGRPQHA